MLRFISGIQSLRRASDHFCVACELCAAVPFELLLKQLLKLVVSDPAVCRETRIIRAIDRYRTALAADLRMLVSLVSLSFATQCLNSGRKAVREQCAGAKRTNSSMDIEMVVQRNTSAGRIAN